MTKTQGTAKMSLSPHQFDGLVRYAGRYPVEQLRDFKAHSLACGCMGPRDGDPFCGCEMAQHLERHLIAVLQRIDETEALLQMRRNLVRALSGAG
jgi:hypothetical protein